ncbi:MAG TPA: hypothetical protein VF021_04350, partial [Longimicrobiales bacterium]
TYVGDQLTTVISLPSSDVKTRRELVVRFGPHTTADDSLLDGVPGRLHRMYESMKILETLWPADWAPDAYVALVQTGNRMSVRPDSAHAELQRLRRDYPAVIERVRQLKGDSAAIRRALVHLGERP